MEIIKNNFAKSQYVPVLRRQVAGCFSEFFIVSQEETHFAFLLYRGELFLNSVSIHSADVRFASVVCHKSTGAPLMIKQNWPHKNAIRNGETRG